MNKTHLMWLTCIGTLALLSSCSQNATPTAPAKPKTESKVAENHKSVPAETLDQTKAQSLKPLSPNQGWTLATVRTDTGEVFIRFNHGRRDLVDNPSYPQTIVFQTIPVKAKDINEHLRSLDVLEDAIKSKMEAISGCVMIQANTGSDYRDLTFVYGGETKGFDAPVKALMSEFPNRMNVHVDKADWSAFKKLVESVPERH